MSVIAEFSVAADAFCLGDALEAVPTATAELDRMVAHSPKHVIPFVWILEADRDVFDEAVTDDSTVEDAEVTDSFEDAHLYHFYWADVVSDRLHVILDHDGVVLEARGTAAGWQLEVRFGSREHFHEFREHFEEFGAVTLHRITAPETPEQEHYRVSPKQREALLIAYESGYYDAPKRVTGEDVARELGITQQAVSQLLQRGTKALIEDTLTRYRGDGN
ncbi:helix-turn-helix domain-containing protein [Salinigranum rubrum]|nr:helix-turn-helix domain-containing protein [Salinigranum rubrum]